MALDLGGKWHGLPVPLVITGGSLLGFVSYRFIKQYRASKAAATTQPTSGSSNNNPLPGWDQLAGMIGPLGGSSPTGPLTGYDSFGVPVYGVPKADPQPGTTPAPGPVSDPAPTVPTTAPQPPPAAAPPAPVAPAVAPLTSIPNLFGGTAYYGNATVNDPATNPFVAPTPVLQLPVGASLPGASGTGQRFMTPPDAAGNTYSFTYG